MADHIELITRDMHLVRPQVNAVVEMLDEKNTIPFIARYRKERTGGLDEEQLRQIEDRVARLRALDERRETILTSIEEQEKMTPELRAEILSALTLTELKDIYQPFKPKRRTRAMIARERGLLPLAERILQQARMNQSAEKIAESFLSEDVPTIEDALTGARDIVAETISDHTEVRQQIRQRAMQWGTLCANRTEDAKDERSVYEIYYEFEGKVDRLRPHQVLAINRGENEKVLRVRMQVPERDWQNILRIQFPPDRRSPFHDQLILAMADAAERLLLPAIERDVRRALTERAEKHAIGVFAVNLKALLSQPPLSGHVVLGLDPGFRTGCKVAIVDPTGKMLALDTVYPHEPQRKWKETLTHLENLVTKHQVTLVTIGNGTASRETERLAAELIQRVKNLHYMITNEAGASVYSASPLARAELPGTDVSLRGAVSIARRVQDPLAELVKIDPKAIGIGLYQHDVNQKELEKALSGVVEDTVNQVGVDVNTASPALLAYVAGIGPRLAERIVSHRDEQGPFISRIGLKQVQGLGPKAFEQSSGILRIRGGSQPLDTSAIHPESYLIAEKVIQLCCIQMDMAIEERHMRISDFRMKKSMQSWADELSCGVPTLSDILEQLVRPGRDPRLDLPQPILRSDVVSMDKLVPGMELRGTVRNVVDFGAFVDIGVKQDGLLHRSQIPAGTRLHVGDIINVEILKVEAERGRIALILR
jgi:uncharacterized protein